jgi:hypothetical protein
MLFAFLSQVVFPNQKLLALIISLLFLAHPIHTEVVANVKSRDEIFSFLFIMLTLFIAHQYQKHKNNKWLALTCLSFFCAILSKEYGATLLILVPLSLYLFPVEKFSLSKISGLLLGLLATFFLYIGIRSKYDLLAGKNDLQEGELLNNPFLLADDTQKLATKFFIFFKYLWVQLIPHPLSSDYGYNSIPYKDFSNLGVWIGILFMGALVWFGFKAFKQKQWIAFAIAFYLGNILLVTNFIFDVGATMGERLIFHSSIGFCIAIAYLILQGFDKSKFFLYQHNAND